MVLYRCKERDRQELRKKRWVGEGDAGVKSNMGRCRRIRGNKTDTQSGYIDKNAWHVVWCRKEKGRGSAIHALLAKFNRYTFSILVLLQYLAMLPSDPSLLMESHREGELPRWVSGGKKEKERREKERKENERVWVSVEIGGEKSSRYGVNRDWSDVTI